MTMPHERSRALVWAGGFLIELARGKTLSLQIRRRAVSIARHFPTIEQLDSMARSEQLCGLEPPSQHPSWVDQCRLGPLRYGTRLEWPSEELEAKNTKDVDRILVRAAKIAGSYYRASRWLSEPLESFNGETPLDLVQADRTQDLLAYLETTEVGALG